MSYCSQGPTSGTLKIIVQWNVCRKVSRKFEFLTSFDRLCFDLVEQLSPVGALLLTQCMFRLKDDKVELLILEAKEEAEKKAKNTPDHSAEVTIQW